MSLTPAFEPGLCSGWLFMIVFPLQGLAVVVLPARIVARTGHPARPQRHRAPAIPGHPGRRLLSGEIRPSLPAAHDPDASLAGSPSMKRIASICVLVLFVP